MGQPAAKQGDKVVGMTPHVFMVPSPSGPVPTPLNGDIDGVLSSDVLIREPERVADHAGFRLRQFEKPQPREIFRDRSAEQGASSSKSPRILVAELPRPVRVYPPDSSSLLIDNQAAAVKGNGDAP